MGVTKLGWATGSAREYTHEDAARILRAADYIVSIRDRFTGEVIAYAAICGGTGFIMDDRGFFGTIFDIEDGIRSKATRFNIAGAVGYLGAMDCLSVCAA